MIEGIGSYSEADIRLSEEELVLFYKKFTRYELEMLSDILKCVHDTNVEKELLVLERVLEKAELKNGYKTDRICITEKASILTDNELMFLHTVAEDSAMIISFAHEIDTIDEVFAEEYIPITEQLESDVKDEIEERIAYYESIKDKSKVK